MSKYELDARFDARQSFYGKALVEEAKTEGNNPMDCVRLYSYGSLVAELVGSDIRLYELATCSQTTIRHVREFLRQYTNIGYDIPVKKLREIQAKTVGEGEAL